MTRRRNLIAVVLLAATLAVATVTPWLIYCLYLRLLDLGHSELVKGLLEIVEKGLPTLPP